MIPKSESLWPLAGFYLLYYAILGVWIPFWPLYLESLGHGAVTVGVTIAFFSATRIIAPILWGYMSDYSGKPVKTIQLGCFCAFLSVFAMFYSNGAIWLTAVLVLFSFFWSGVLPQFEVVTLSHLGPKRSHQYGRIRSGGSFGFIASVMLLGLLFEKVDLSWFPASIAILLGFLWISTVFIPEEKKVSNSQSDSNSSFLQLISRRVVWVALVCVVLIQISFAPYYGFFSIHLETLGYGTAEIGAIWSIGVVAEIILFFNVGKLFAHLGIRFLLLISILMTFVRWLIIWKLADHVWILVISQFMHAFSFGAFHVCMIEYVRRVFPGRHHGKGQALFNSFGYGIGAVLGAVASGFLWDSQGAFLYFAAAILALVAFLLALLFFTPISLASLKTKE